MPFVIQVPGTIPTPPAPPPPPPPASPRTTFTEGVLGDYVAWANDDSTGYLTALGQMYEQVFGIVMDQGNPDQPTVYTPGWSTLLDPDNCPDNFLPFLSQFNGTGVQPGTDGDEARATIKAEGGWHRGTLAAMTAAAARNLAPGARLQLLERTAGNGLPDAYHVVIQFDAADCPDQAALVYAVEAQKPGGIQITYGHTSDFTWGSAIHDWADDSMTWAQTADVQP